MILSGRQARERTLTMDDDLLGPYSFPTRDERRAKGRPQKRWPVTRLFVTARVSVLAVFGQDGCRGHGFKRP